jgi:anti-sigma factor (TIGR02949 family)
VTNTTTAIIACDYVLDRINDFLDREVDEATANLIRQHIAQCEGCSDEADCWMVMRQVLKRTYQPEPAPPGLLARIKALIVPTFEADAGELVEVDARGLENHPTGQAGL